jgi:hypothetical protein
MRAVNARFWEALRGLLVEAGLRELPGILTFERLPVPETHRGTEGTQFLPRAAQPLRARPFYAQPSLGAFCHVCQIAPSVPRAKSSSRPSTFRPTATVPSVAFPSR